MNIKTEKKGKCGYLYPVAVIIAFIIGVFLRLYHFGVVPNGLHQDEAYAAYEAYSLLNYGKDSWGYVNPIYFTAWGSGMNVLESYLMIEWIAVFGL